MMNGEMAQILHSASSGDSSAMRAVLDRCRPLISSECTSVLRKRPGMSSHREDLLQDGVEIVVRAILGYQGEDVDVFMEELSRKLHNDLPKVAKRYSPAQEESLPIGMGIDFEGEDEDLSEIIQRKDLSRAMLQATMMLPSKQRVAIILYYYVGLTQDEAAERIGIKQAGLSRRLERARKQLQENLKVLGVDVEALL